MKEVQDYSGEKTDIETTCIFLSLYGLVLVISFIKSIICIRNIRAEYNWSILWLYTIISITVILRIIWCSRYFYNYSENNYNLLDTLASASLELLGYTFIAFWLMIYFDINPLLSLDQFKRYYAILFVVYTILVALTFITRTYLVYFKVYSLRSAEITLCFGAFVSILVSLALIISGKILVKKVNLVFSQRIGSRVSKRLKCIILTSSFIYISKSCLFLVAEFLYRSSYTTFYMIFLFIYVFGTEIFPLISVLIFLKPNLLENEQACSSWIPSALKTERSSSKYSSLLSILFKKSVLLSSFENRNRSVSLPIFNQIVREFSNLQEYSNLRDKGTVSSAYI
ncbi:hypothetical protein SteCoe_37147 [Stentor coeruleus]|uniref:THH1/TOM1/TOM3 domain-containing protein n=1 Tax=Stentor coeruleus TaxID=5963 RepID=A0A1R2ANK9_9CILI|nr:hypothetical protein SteCoe_37147 [Stentor coeruleus]